MSSSRIQKARLLLFIYSFQSLATFANTTAIYVNSSDTDILTTFEQPGLRAEDMPTPSAPIPAGGGPTTPEASAYTPIGSQDMVDPFSGDLTYTIPLMEVDGYPISLQYHSGITTEEEASWVGLGWSLNPGSVSRDVRGLPDDFNGDDIERQTHLKDNETTVIGGQFGMQVYGTDVMNIGISQSSAISYNSYEGWGIKAGVGASLSASAGDESNKLGGSLGLTAGIDSRDGGFLDPEIGLSGEQGKMSGEVGIGLSISSREGLEALDFKMETKYARYASRSEGSLQFASPTFQPSIQVPMQTSSFLFRGTLGGEANGLHPNGTIYGSHTIEKIASPYRSENAYGYIYSQNATAADQLDFNREKDGPYFKEVPNLAATQFTYDNYVVSASGINEQFRPFRGEVGTVYDPTTASTSNGASMGAEVGLGNLVHGGMDITVMQNHSTTEKWTNDNQMTPYARFRDGDSTLPFFEPVYFKSLGEISRIADQQLFDTWNGFEAVQVELHDPDAVSIGSAKNRLSNGVTISDADQVRQNERTARASEFMWFTAQDMQHFGSAWFDLRIFQKLNASETPIPRIDEVRRSDHISAIEVKNNTGITYQYALPAYNKLTKRVSFNIGESAVDEALEAEDGVVTYASDDCSTSNTRGENHYFNAEITPAYAYAWMLTGVYSADYEDVRNDGPTPDDLGTYTKFSYVLAEEDFNWRTSYGNNTAEQDQRYLSDPDDDMAHYTYGVKELWYLSSIESRNLIAIFDISDRNDAVGVMGESGGMDNSKRHKKLDAIRLYTQQEYFLASQEDRLPVPIKEVHFAYDYSLCNGAPGSLEGVGKLTLKKVWFTHGTSAKGAASPYTFTYSNNPDYTDHSNDRWGYYKPQTDGAYENRLYPYTEQQNSEQDLNASAWCLSNIHLPSGGDISIEYESDSYAYVQDRKAMIMTRVIGLRNNATTSSFSSEEGSEIYTKEEGSINNNNYIYFDLPLGATSLDRDNLFACIKDIKQLFISARIKLKPEDETAEAVSAFLPIDIEYDDFNTLYGFGADGTGWIKIQEADGKQALAKAGFEFVRKFRPQILQDETYAPDDFLSAAANFVERFEEVFAGGVENYLVNEEFCSKLSEGSFIRINLPAQNKLGGGCRVKMIRLSDNWGSMQPSADMSGLTFAYGQEYYYTTIDPATGRTISSGVASYEPLVGGEENPFATPINYRIEKPLSAALNYYQLEPIGESFFPAPQVGYSRVMIRGLQHPNVTKHNNGSTVIEHYTAKDFPVITKQTSLVAIPKDVIVLLDLYNYRLNAVTVSQGFYIETNNMHGKLKSRKQFNELGVEISGTTYIYQTDNFDHLSNTADIIDPETGRAIAVNMGINYDIICDARRFVHESGDFGVGVNLETATYGPVPTLIPVLLPKVTEGKSEYRGTTVTKHIHRMGILKRVETFDKGSLITMQHLAFDAITGNPLLSATDNAFGKQEYSVSLPAYWAYPQMGAAANNQGIIFDHVSVSGSSFMNNTGAFIPGDLLKLSPTGDATTPGIFASVYRVSSNTIMLIDAAGSATGIPNGNYDIKVMRSGYANDLSSTVASYITEGNVIKNDGSIDLDPDNVIESSAGTYGDFWQTDISYRRNNEQLSCACEETTATFNEIKDVVNDLIGHPAYQVPSSTLHYVGTTAYRMSVNSGPYAEVEVLPDGAVDHRYIISLSTINESSFTKFSMQCKVVWGDIVYDDMSDPCSSPNGFTINCTSGAQLYVYAADKDLLNCKQAVTHPTTLICGAEGAINPYLTGILGNWRPVATYKFMDGRTQTGHTQTSGFYRDYMPFWTWSAAGGLTQNADHARWMMSDSVITYNAFGKPLEIANALQQVTGSYYGNGHNLLLAEGAGAHYTDLAFDGFEEYAFYIDRINRSTDIICQLDGHFLFKDPRDFVDFEAQVALLDYLDQDVAHTGTYSLKVSPEKPITIEKEVWKDATHGDRGIKTERVTGSTFNMRASDMIQDFSPHAGRYRISVWVHEPGALATTTSYEKPALSVTLDGATTTFKADGPIIDGWQQITGEVIIRDDHSNISITMKSTMGSVRFDDLRMQPFWSNMYSYVYDANSLLTHAILGENNHASFFEYSEESNLIRKKFETEKGIVTVLEVNQGLPKIK